MTKLFKIFLVSIISILIIGTVTLFALNEPLPQGKEGPEAELLADKMLESLNKSAWDTVSHISWNFKNLHDFEWDRINNRVIVTWDEYRVELNTENEQGIAFKNDIELGADGDEIIKEALGYFYNDSFWLIAPFKVKDFGTERRLVDYNGKEALLVTYTSGGITPGDSYLWILDENYKPIAWKFWVSIIPIGGMEFSWEDWQIVNGAEISLMHKGVIDIGIKIL